MRRNIFSTYYLYSTTGSKWSCGFLNAPTDSNTFNVAGNIMDVLKIVISKKQDVLFEPTEADLLINGMNLIDRIYNFERGFIKTQEDIEIQGIYVSLSPGQLYRNFHNLPGNSNTSDNFVTLLDCQCGGIRCWPLICKIYQTKKIVYWKDFAQFWHSKEGGYSIWDYSAFGSFAFDIASYEKEIRKLQAIMPTT